MAGEQLFYDRPTFPAQLDMAHPLTRGLIGCWVFNENEPSCMRVWDSSPYGNNGSVLGGTPRARSDGRLFNGTNDLIIIDALSTMMTTFSWIIWLNPDVVTPTKYPLAKRHVQYLRINTDARIYISLNGTNANQSITEQTLTAGQWVCIGVRYDDAGDRKAYVFINGVPTTYGGGGQQIAVTGSITDDVSESITFGGYGDTGELWWPGRIGGALIYKNRVLNPAEFQDLYLHPYAMFLR